MAIRHYMVVGLAGAGLAGALWLPQIGGRGEPAVPVLASLEFPDMDGDGKPETLRVLGGSRPATALQATKGDHIHPVLPLAAPGPYRFEGTAPRWRLLDAEGRTALSLLAYASAAGAPMDMVALGATAARRFHWIDRGFLKLEADRMTPGFSASLFMLGDSADLLASINGRPGPDGIWRLPLATPLSFKVGLDDQARIEDLTFSAQAIRSVNGIRAGLPITEVTDRLPGDREGARYLAPRYGLVVHLADDDRIRAITVRRPWKPPLTRR